MTLDHGPNLTLIAETGSSEAATEPTVRYEADSYVWTIQQIGLLRSGYREALDLPHLAQVLSGLAAQDRNKLKAAVEQILQALLQWDHAPEAARSRAWTLTIHQQRRRVTKQLRRQPGLTMAEPGIAADAYAAARPVVIEGLGLDEEALPLACPYSWADIMDRDIAWLDA